jgi:hypothetical protein
MREPRVRGRADGEPACGVLGDVKDGVSDVGELAVEIGTAAGCAQAVLPLV